MRYCRFAFDDLSEGCVYYINRHAASPITNLLPYYVTSLGINAQGCKYYTDRCGYHMLFLCLTLEGIGSVVAGQEGHLLLPGDLMILDCKYPHYYGTQSDHWRFLWIQIQGFGTDTFNRIAPNGIFFQHLRDTSLVHSLYDDIVPLIKASRDESNIDISEKISVFMHQLLRNEVSADNPLLPVPLDNALLYIRSHICEDLSVEDIAARENYSVYHFTHLFKRHLGVSPYRYITNLRLHNAAVMLLFTNHSVEEVADYNHFSSASRFIQHFRRLYGMTPQQYRKSSQEGMPIRPDLTVWEHSPHETTPHTTNTI